jgi:hypothetical protein
VIIACSSLATYIPNVQKTNESAPISPEKCRTYAVNSNDWARDFGIHPGERDFCHAPAFAFRNFLDAFVDLVVRFAPGQLEGATFNGLHARGVRFLAAERASERASVERTPRLLIISI